MSKSQNISKLSKIQKKTRIEWHKKSNNTLNYKLRFKKHNKNTTKK